MPAVTVEVPARQRDDLLTELLGLYAVKADALHEAASAYVSNRRALDPLLAHRAELAAVDQLIDQVGWRLDLPPLPTELSGESYLIAEITRGALHRALAELEGQLSEAPGGSQTVDALAVYAARPRAARGAATCLSTGPRLTCAMWPTRRRPVPNPGTSHGA